MEKSCLDGVNMSFWHIDLHMRVTHADGVVADLQLPSDKTWVNFKGKICGRAACESLCVANSAGST
eukprot:364475-Chlamydomonas_euryale.AAC.15